VKIDILSLFPDYFRGPFDVSIVQRARERGLVDIGLVDIRDFAEGKHRQVDDRPYGGGPGMVLMPGPVTRAIDSVKTDQSHVVYLSPQGKPLTARCARRLAGLEHLVLLCGHYEGIDERAIAARRVDEEISIGDYVLTSGCPAAVVLVDATLRFVPGVLGHAEAADNDSFEEGGFDCPHYTRPDLFEGRAVPEILKSGDHAKIVKWRKECAAEKTARIRPELQGENR
jgi:tRNA (guanine37-N1)-methyltransferase